MLAARDRLQLCGGEQIADGLKPNVYAAFFGPAKQLGEKVHLYARKERPVAKATLN